MCWALPGVAPACLDIAWYVCLNRARLPESKEATLQAHGEALERHGVATQAWWGRQCALSLLATLMLFGWEKALGDDDEAGEERAWWEARAGGRTGAVTAASADRHLVAEIRAAYDRSAEGWATGPAVVYRRLAAAVVGTAPASLAGHRVLDLGAGTGVASEVLAAAGAQPVGVDLAPAMLAHRRSHRPAGVAGDARAGTRPSRRASPLAPAPPRPSRRPPSPPVSADARVDCLDVEAGLDDPELAVEWRLNMPYTVGFVAALSPSTRAGVRARATAALGAALPSSVPVLVLHANVT